MILFVVEKKVQHAFIGDDCMSQSSIEIRSNFAKFSRHRSYVYNTNQPITFQIQSTHQSNNQTINSHKMNSFRSSLTRRVNVIKHILDHSTRQHALKMFAESPLLQQLRSISITSSRRTRTHHEHDWINIESNALNKKRIRKLLLASSCNQFSGTKRAIKIDMIAGDRTFAFWAKKNAKERLPDREPAMGLGPENKIAKVRFV